VDTLHVKRIDLNESHHIEHNGENKILNKYYISEINYFKVFYDVTYDVG
jgi:hypothetical protein